MEYLGIKDSSGDSISIGIIQRGKHEGKIWVAIEIDERENDVALTPDQARTLANHLLTLANKAEQWRIEK